MKQIKTIYSRSSNAFDEEVNLALKDGWTLTRRTFDPEGFLAELEKDEAPEVLVEASQELVEICKEMAEGIGELIGRFTDKLTKADKPEERTCRGCKYEYGHTRLCIDCNRRPLFDFYSANTEEPKT